MQQAQLPLREQGVSFVLSYRHNATHENLIFFKFYYTLRAGFFKQTCMATDSRVSIRIALTAVLHALSKERSQLST